MDFPNVPEPQNNVPRKLEGKIPKVLIANDKNHQGFVIIFDKQKEKQDMVINVPSDSFVYMLVVL